MTSGSFGDGGAIPARCAFGVPAEEGHATAGGGNRNPELRWSGTPAGTRSFVVLAFDADAPIDASEVNVEDRTIAFDAARADFAHWLVVDIPADVSEIAEGADSEGITPRGKPTGPTDYGGIRGANDYTAFLAEDPEMGGTYGGYDGPFPPWNDERVHRYRFVVYALDVPTLGLAGAFTLQDARRAMQGHILGQAEWGGTYALNPAARAA